MRIDLPLCDFKKCKEFFDGNCSKKEKYEMCEYQYMQHNYVEVVRCKDCIYFIEHNKEYSQSVEGSDGDCYLRLINSTCEQFCACKSDDFCSLGKKDNIK